MEDILFPKQPERVISQEVREMIFPEKFKAQREAAAKLAEYYAA